MPRMGRPRTKRKDLPDGLHFSADRGYYYRGTKITDGKRVYKTLGRISRDDAIREWVKIHHETPDDAIDGTVGALIDRYVREALPKKRESTREQYRKQTVKLRELFGDRLYCASESQASSGHYFRRMDVQRYLSDAASPVMANRHIALLSSIFRHACNTGMTEYNPCLGVEKNPEKARTRYLERHELISLQRAAKESPIIRLIMLFGHITGMREGDILALRWQQVKDGYIWVEQSKTGKRQRIKLTWGVRCVLNAAKNLRGSLTSMHIFHTREGQPYTGDGFRAMWARVVKKSGVTDVHFHDLRARAVSDAIDSGRDGGKLAGHSSDEITRRVYDRAPSKVRPNR